MLNTSPPLSIKGIQCAKFAQPAPRELSFQWMTSPDSSPGLLLHAVISSYSGSYDLRSSTHINPIILLHVCCTLLTKCSPKLWASQAAPCLWHIIAFCPLSAPLYPLAFSYLWNWTHPIQISRSHRASQPQGSCLQSWLPTLTHLIVPFLCSPATVPSHRCLSPQWSHHCSQTVVYPIRNESSGYLYCYISPTSHIDVFAFFLIATELDPSAAPLSPFGLIYPYPSTAIANLSIWEASWQVIT